MARRSDHTREELINLAINAGTEIIAQRGLEHFSARATAARIGYAVGTIYHLFGNLDGFLLHINAATLDEWYAELTAGLARRPGDPVRYLANAYLDFARRNPRRFNALFEHHPEGQVPEWYAAKSVRMFVLLEEALAQRLEPARARHMARLLWASVHGITVLSLTGRLGSGRDDPAGTLMDTMLGMMLPGNGHRRPENGSPATRPDEDVSVSRPSEPPVHRSS